MPSHPSTSAEHKRSTPPEQPTLPLAPTATTPTAPAMEGVHAEDEDELEMNYEESDSTIDTAHREMARRYRVWPTYVTLDSSHPALSSAITHIPRRHA